MVTLLSVITRRERAVVIQLDCHVPLCGTRNDKTLKADR